MLVHADRVIAEIGRVFKLIHEVVVHQMRALRIEQRRVNIDPDRRMLLFEVLRQFGVRHQMEPHQLHDRSTPDFSNKRYTNYTTPATASRVARPASIPRRLLADSTSIHSSNECSRAPVPPEPIRIAGMLMLIGMLASVEDASNRVENPFASIAACAKRTSSCDSLVWPAGRSPIGRISTVTDPFRVERMSFSAVTDACTIPRNRSSSVASSDGNSERRSNSVHTAFGIELIEVPPPVTLAL